VLTDASVQRVAWASLFNDYLVRRPAYEGQYHSPFTDDDYWQLVDGKPRPDGVANFLASRGISLFRDDIRFLLIPIVAIDRPTSPAEALKCLSYNGIRSPNYREKYGKGLA
jgi:hypothetical protein